MKYNECNQSSALEYDCLWIQFNMVHWRIQTGGGGGRKNILTKQGKNNTFENGTSPLRELKIVVDPPSLKTKLNGGTPLKNL
jgi:hypothetical protein